MPKDVEIDGIRSDGRLCRRYTKAPRGYRGIVLDKGCRPLTKVFFTHYQYFPFFIASLGIMYYVPYILFRIINSDIISLKSTIKTSAEEVDTVRIKDCYFNYNSNGGILMLRLRVLGTTAVKVRVSL